MRKDRLTTALLVYAIVLMTAAGVCAKAFYRESEEVMLDVSMTPTMTVSPAFDLLIGDNKVTQSSEPKDNSTKPTANLIPTMPESIPQMDAWEMLHAKVTKEWRSIIGERCIVIPKPEEYNPGQAILFTLSDMPVERSIALQFEGCEATEYYYDQIERIAGNTYFNAEPNQKTEPGNELAVTGAAVEIKPAKDTAGENRPAVNVPTEVRKGENEPSENAPENSATGENAPIYSGTTQNKSKIGSENETAEPVSVDPLCDMTQHCSLQEDGSYSLYIELLLDKTYVYNVYETEEYYYISLRDAKSVYDKIVVLDAGHGGWDTGTSSADGRYLEKDVNLNVLLYLQELLQQQEEIVVYYTRTNDRSVGLSQRIGLANSLKADMFISIHCNNAYQNPDANGTEVLYSQYQDDWEGLNSKGLSQICLDELLMTLQRNNRGLFARGDDLTVLAKAEVPTTLIEIAFMSNEADMAVLQIDENQKAAAEAIYRAILNAYKVLE